MEGTPFGRYRLIEVLGRGGMGEVWRAYDTDTDRVVALKVLPAHLASDPQFEQRFQREAHIAASLSEPHVVPIHSYGEIDGRLYVDMRLIEGQDLTALLTHGPLPPERAVRIIDQIAAALDEAHKTGLVHRDVKPSNILVTPRDFAYLIDFGIAAAAGATKLTGTGNVIGTWAYLAPERITTGQSDGRVDVYSLACVLHECLTGSQPFPGNSIEQVVGAHLGLPPPRPSMQRADVPVELDAVIAAGMAKNPDDRYSTATALADAARDAVTASTTRPRFPPLTDATQVAQPLLDAAPTQYRAATDPAGGTPDLDGAKTSSQSRIRPRVYVAALSALIAIVGVVAAIVLFNSRNSVTSIPNTGPFTGEYLAEYGPAVGLGNTAVDNTSPTDGTYSLRSECRPDGCVAAANANTGPTLQRTLIFDDFGGRWQSVGVVPGAAAPPGFKSCPTPVPELWEVLDLQPNPDGTLAGDYTLISGNDCATRRAVTFTRIGDADVNSIPDPATDPARSPSPAEALRGRYRVIYSRNRGPTFPDDKIAETACLRTGERCVSYIHSPIGMYTLIFADAKWVWNIDAESKCNGPGAGTILMKASADLTLPVPPQNPITSLIGHGRDEITGGTACDGNSDLELKLERVGD